MPIRRNHDDEGAGDTAVLTRPPLEMSAVLPPAPEEDDPKPRLSILRILLALLILGGAGYGAFAGIHAKLTASAATRQATFFAPYVDVTLTPTYQFQLPAQDPARQSVLGFVVASSSSACTPSWGGVYGIDQANQTLALGTRIAQLEANGASVLASFGGRDHTALALSCHSAAALASAYESVIHAYHLHAIDLDIEGAALDSYAAEQRRTAALRIVEHDAAKAHQRLDVWLTLPVEPNGLQGNARSVVNAMLRARVRFTGVNVMAMDFATPPSPGTTMLDLVERSLTSTHAQLSRILPRYGIHHDGAKLWRLIGATVMIGQNDLAGERFTVADAQGLRSFARRHGLARVSMWSINRDQQCGGGYGAAVLSNTCSGTPQASLAFAHVLNHLAGTVATAPASGRNLVRPVKPDTNPADAPFPQWSPTAAYPSGYKVVENGEIYAAKWYTAGQDPAAQYQYAWQSPWELLGPVLPSDHAPTIEKPAPGTYPAWSANRRYIAGERVLYEGLPFEAKWSSRGVAPSTAAGVQPSSPWRPLYRIPGEPRTATSGTSPAGASGTSGTSGASGTFGTS